jgi:hypothetical protein
MPPDQSSVRIGEEFKRSTEIRIFSTKQHVLLLLLF